MLAGLRIQRVPLDRVLPLRATVLRDGDATAAVWSLDDHREAVHLAATVGEEIVGVASYVPDPFPDDPRRKSWRVRGVAVREDVRGAGVGSTLIARVTQDAASAPDRPELVWCNARTSALGFWQRAGFDIVGEEFLTETGIAHFRAVRLVRPAADG